MAEAKAEGAAPSRYEADEDTVECAGGAPAECFSALPSRGKTSPRHETHHVGIRIYITHRNSERAPLNCLCLCDLRSPLAALVFSSSLHLQWTARCCYCWLCSVCCLPPLVVSGAISFFLLRLCLGWCPLSVELPPRLASRRRDRRLCPVAGLWRTGGWWWWLFSLF